MVEASLEVANRVASRLVTILEVDSEVRDGLAHVVLRGELDLSTVGQVNDELERLETHEPTVVVLDLSQLRFLDSTGLRCVVTANDRAKKDGRRFVVVRGPEAVQRVFAITRLDERLEMVDDASAVSTTG
jgi:anti-anti-sigma factor